MYSVVLCTCENEKEARKIASETIGKRLAACVNIVPKVESLYWWKGKVVRGGECLLIIKTKKSLTERLMENIKKIHSYKTPEIIELSITDGNREYLDWITEVTRR